MTTPLPRNPPYTLDKPDWDYIREMLRLHLESRRHPDGRRELECPKCGHAYLAEPGAGFTRGVCGNCGTVPLARFKPRRP